jgi:cyanophycinase
MRHGFVFPALVGLILLGILGLGRSAAPGHRAADMTGTAPVVCPMVPATSGPEASPRGYLFIIGGGEREEGMMKRFIALADHFQGGKVVIYTMASGVPGETGPAYADEFRKLGAKKAVWENLTHEQALVEDNTAVLDDAGGVFFSGGDQARLTAALLDTPVLARIKDLYRRGAVVGGTSAGAAVMSEVMITGDEARTPDPDAEEADKFRTIEAGNIVTGRGFGFLTTAVIDQHHIARKRENRLVSVVAEHPDLLGIGVDEDTAIVVAPDRTFEVLGEGAVLILDPARARIRTQASKLIAIEGLVLHVLVPGERFNLDRRSVVE